MPSTEPSWVIAMLEKLVDKFVQERTILEKEMDSKYAYEMLMAELKKSIEEATEDRTEKEATELTTTPLA